MDKLDRAALEEAGFGFNINVLVGGQIAGQKHEIHYVYPQGNTLQASVASPFLQIGEFKYAQADPRSRGFTYETPLRDAVTFGMLSMEATVKSNVSVGPPIDIFALRERFPRRAVSQPPVGGGRRLLPRKIQTKNGTTAS